ncbi:class I SAM-dependent methyltransferase [Luteimonas marina]|uniref:Class I SAM-dependent methyltransferase n=1 Tax=Luteimonas marina TaxID=488485 RepID=A0A5C5UD58_9GAMM|nr:class I SAM-dependent methyltransferase [Luteimonas marina]TWT23552.1 class I SAM-dependent methyltransferase [Luteimonas marina]
MQTDELVSLFDQQAAGYDQQWAKTASIRDCLYLMLVPLFAGLPAQARVLCVGVGTGVEMAHLARTFPQWRFTAVEPSSAMLEVCRQRAESDGFADRCSFHHGFVDSLPGDAAYDAATCFLVSQFLLDRDARVRFFADIAARLRPGGLLASSDLASDVASPAYAVLLPAWMRMMRTAEVSDEEVERMRAAYARDVAILPPAQVASILEESGFADPTQFFQAGLIHAWMSRRA